jgi:predicted transcriptional regulator
MATMTIRIPDGKHERLRRLAERHGISLNKLVDEWASMALAQFDAETRFRARAARGNARRGLALLDKLDRASPGHGAALKSRKPKG